MSVLLLAASCTTTLPPENTKPLVTIIGAKLIDGSGAAPVEDSVVVIEGTRIRAAGPRSSTPVPKGGEILDGKGKVVIPGLIDVHVHYFGERADMEQALRAELYWGVTTVRSVGLDTADRLAILGELRSGQLPGPRVYTSGLGFTAPKGHPVELQEPLRPGNPDQAREQVRELAAQKVDFIKMWVESAEGKLPKITPEVRQAIVEEAAKHHIPVVAHITEEEDVYQLAQLGVNDFLHTVANKEPMDEKFIEFCKRNSISFAPTLTVLEESWFVAGAPQLLEDPQFRHGLSPGALERVGTPEARQKILADPGLRASQSTLAKAQRFTRQMSQAGVKLAAGSDSGAGVIAHGWGTHNEMALLAEAGLTPLEVLHVATQRSAELLSGAAPAFGLLQAGKIADLLLLDADPLEDIHNSRKIGRVMQAGQWIDRPALLDGR